MRIVNSFLLFALVLTAVRTAGAEPGSLAPADIRLGAILHLTGDLMMVSTAFREGLELRVAEYERTKSAREPAIRILIEDGANNPRASNTAAQKLLSVSKVDLLILESYLDVMADAPLIERAQVPTITLWDSNRDIENAGEWIFGIGPWTPSAGTVAAEFSWRYLQRNRAVIFYNTDSWSESVQGEFRNRFEAIGGEVVSAFSLNANETDFRTVLTKAKGSGADLIYAPLVFNLVPFYTQLQQLDLRMEVVSSDIIAAEHIRQNPAAFEGVYQTAVAEPESALYQTLVSAYSERYGKEITLPWFVATGYDSVSLFIQASRKRGWKNNEIKEALYQVKNFEGAATSYTINERGVSPQDEVMYSIINSEFHRAIAPKGGQLRADETKPRS